MGRRIPPSTVDGTLHFMLLVGMLVVLRSELLIRRIFSCCAAWNTSSEIIASWESE